MQIPFLLPNAQGLVSVIIFTSAWQYQYAWLIGVYQDQLSYISVLGTDRITINEECFGNVCVSPTEPKKTMALSHSYLFFLEPQHRLDNSVFEREQSIGHIIILSMSYFNMLSSLTYRAWVALTNV